MYNNKFWYYKIYQRFDDYDEEYKSIKHANLMKLQFCFGLVMIRNFVV